MSVDSATSRRRVIEGRIVMEVGKYYGQYREGMAMQILSAKYSRALVGLGGFPEVMDQLEKSGQIAIDMSVTGRRTVRPGLGLVTQADDHVYAF